ncbi:unnamed protein product [Phyllotreta striolata]|uniref:Coiled-coil domain-containing protein 39 n=1 Tax=Phyllotreta striolata TaxID=444603 RepID=A0A9N9TMA1_PHYSR|nr:unnamed protein product [Phyllotreta striolata]
MALNMEDVLKQLGWTDGFQMPIANSENKLLEEELARLSLLRHKNRTNLDNVSTRLENMNDHLKYVNQESEQTQKLITAHKVQLESLETVYSDTKTDNRNAAHAFKVSTHSLKEAQVIHKERENELQKLITKAEKLRVEMGWDEEALRAWNESLKKRDDDIGLLKKFFKDDDRRFNEMEARRKHLKGCLVSVKEKMEKIASNYHNAEQMVERSGKVLKQLGIERDSLINQWKNTVRVLQQRDNEIMRGRKHLVHLNDVLAVAEEKLDIEKKFLANEKKNNKELEQEILEANEVNTRYRKEMADTYQYLMTTQAGLQTLKRNMSKVAVDLKNERLKYKTLEEQYDEKVNFCQEFSDNLVKLNEELEMIRNSAMTSEQRTKSMENMIIQEEAAYNQKLLDIEKINGEIFRSEQLLKDQVAIASNLEIEINLSVCTSNQLRKHINSKRKDLDKIKVVVYEMEYRIDECERKLLEMAEAQKQEVPEEIQIKIQDLEKSLTEHKEVHHSLQCQVDRLREDMRRLSVVITADKEVLESLRDKCENSQLIYDISKKQIASAQKSMQEKQVEENMMKLRINYIEINKKKEEKQIYNLEKMRLNLEQAMKERQLEINSQKQILLIKKRSLDEDKSRLKGDLTLRRLRVEQYQKKYDMAISGLGKDENGEPLTLAAIKIKNAQEKFFLQEEGDSLDNKIKTAEKEIVALENTLKVINLTNTAFKKNLKPVTDTEPEYEEMHALEKELRETFEELKDYRNEVTSKESQLQETLQKLKNVEEELHKNKEEVQNMEEEIIIVTKQEQDKEQKLKRVECELKKLSKQLKGKNKKVLYKYNRDFEIRQLQDINKKALYQLQEIGTNSPSLMTAITQLLDENHLELPEGKITPSTYSAMSTPSCYSDQINTQRTTISSVSEKSERLVSMAKVMLEM